MLASKTYKFVYSITAQDCSISWFNFTEKLTNLNSALLLQGELKFL